MYRVVSFVSQNIPSDKQRLIFKGKVLQDDKKLSEYGNYIFYYMYSYTDVHARNHMR